MKKALFLIPAIALCVAMSLLTDSGRLAAQSSVPGMQNLIWPADKVPADLPPYTDGKLTGSASTGKNEYMIKVMETNDAALKAYLSKLQGMGWDVSSSTYESVARKGAYRVEFKIGTSFGLQITIYTAEKGVWPGNVPEVLTQPRGCDLLDIQLTENGDNAWLFHFTCQGMQQQEAFAYMDGLLKSGWSGDRSMVARTTTWRGKTYGISVEIYEIEAGGNATFTVNFDLQ
ncbi:MAG: hypothetical protein FWD79_08210 [Desulfobulbus sp.]|nr:hypothetical protein [Desulfobulbus sp.]